MPLWDTIMIGLVIGSSIAFCFWARIRATTTAADIGQRSARQAIHQDLARNGTHESFCDRHHGSQSSQGTTL